MNLMKFFAMQMPAIERLVRHRDELLRDAGGLGEALSAAERDSSALREALSAAERDSYALREALSATERDAATLREILSVADQQSKLFVPPGHFYSPICDVAEAATHLTRVRNSLPDSLAGIKIDRDAMIALWKEMLPFLRSAPFPDGPDLNFRYWYDNSSYSYGDGGILHAMLRLNKPRRLIEIGSGWSSACTLDTVERYLDRGCELTFIEPYPQLLRERLGAAADGSRIINSRVQDVPLETFDVLDAGDILFIDSTHVLRTGSDVCCELFEILPRLAPGVIVHFHDMFWPFEYPHNWAVEDNRSWNELQAIRAFLYGNSDWEVIWFSDYMAQFERPMIEATCPRVLRNTGGALWLRRRGAYADRVP